MSRSAAKLVEAVEQVGGHLVSEGGWLKVSAPKPLPAGLLDDLRHNKAALIRYLNVQDEPPAEWTAAVVRLQQLERPATVSEARWQQVRSDAARLLEWAPMLAAMDWTTEDVFGRDDLDRQSLAWRVRGQTIWTVVSENSDAVVLRGADGRQTFIYRRADK